MFPTFYNNDPQSPAATDKTAPYDIAQKHIARESVVHASSVKEAMSKKLCQ
jgi:hypothetical protein